VFMTTESRILPFPCWRRFIVLAVALCVSAFLPPAMFEWSRIGLANAEYWRLATGHWVHLGVGHLSLNLAGLMIVCLMFKRHPPLTEWVAYLLLSPLVISLGLLWQAPDLAWYRGFSGCLHGLLVFTALFNFRSEQRWSLLVLGFVALKLALENAFYTPEVENSLIGGRVILQAHWLGAITGAIAGLLSILAAK
jgi:rhomboid family GlyGly-CTERM serine protease